MRDRSESALRLTLASTARTPTYVAMTLFEVPLARPIGQRWQYGAWDAGWWTPWKHKEIRDNRVLYFARRLWKGSYQAMYVARATDRGHIRQAAGAGGRNVQSSRARA